jgi:hypothetical protein
MDEKIFWISFIGCYLSYKEELREKIEALEKAGFDEAIIAYGDMKDLETAAQLIKG